MTTGCVYSLTEIDGWNRVLVCVAALESTVLGVGGWGERERQRQTRRARRRERVCVCVTQREKERVCV